jgi:SAM-dependent methyltransferase/uncharacterized protein YbaR (Trm112 family)
VRWSHFEALRPVCPRCRVERTVEVPLEVATRIVEEPGGLRDGVLHCSDEACRMEYPVIDGIPILFANVRAYLSDNLFHVTLRRDLSEVHESMLGDAAGPGTAWDATRQHLSTYTWDHYEDLSPDAGAVGSAAGAVSRCLDAAVELAGVADDVPAPALDIGCSVGRSAFGLAQRSSGLVLGIDVNFSMLQIAHRVLREGVVRYARRRVGVVYDRREFAVDVGDRERVDFWACDALALPFASGTFGFVSAFNVLDCVQSPHGFLESVASALSDGGRAVLSTPYDWSTNVTPMEAWIGGHSQRGPTAGAAEPFLRTLLTPGAHPQSSTRLRITGELDHVPWQARLHERSTVAYSAHVVAAETRDTEPGENVHPI